MNAVTEPEMRIRIAVSRRSGTDRRTRARRGSPTPPRTRPCRRRGPVGPRARCRAWRCGGCTPPGASTARSPRRRWPSRRVRSRMRASSLGKSSSATSAPAIALRVVSAPAAHSSEKKNCSSASVSVGGSSPSRRASATTLNMSSAGLRRASRAISAAPYSNIAAPARAASSVDSNASRLPRKSKTCSIHSNSWWRSASGIPISMQIACIGQLARDIAHEVALATVERGVDEQVGPPHEVGFEPRDHAWA